LEVVVEFIFMLTQEDSTVSDAEKVLKQVAETGLRYVGFKDVGTTPELRRQLVSIAHDSSLEVMIELVSPDAATERASLASAVAAGADWILGGTQVEAGCETVRGTGIKYCPFPGQIVGHPSVLQGTIMSISGEARSYVARDEVFGVDLLAYRHSTVDPLELIAAVASECGSAPVVVAGSIRTDEQIRAVAAAGAWGFTIGSAIFDEQLDAGVPVAKSVERVLSILA
jgi:tryptophan synthase alpha subunit